MSETPPTKEQEVPFGPFTNVPLKLIHPVGFDCPVCKTPVRRFGAVVPNRIVRVIIYTCGCAKSVVCWEDEQQPGTAKRWRKIIKVARRASVDVVIFNGGKD